MSQRAITINEHPCHELKTWPAFFEPIESGVKTFEIRTNDRGFAVGDYLWLREYDPLTSTYTGQSVVKRVSYLLDAPDFCGLSLGYVALSLGSLSNRESSEVFAVLEKGTR